ncbi:hypothetical protein GCM10027565_22000 [Bordetella tumulicola]
MTYPATDQCEAERWNAKDLHEDEPYVHDGGGADPHQNDPRYIFQRCHIYLSHIDLFTFQVHDKS